MKKITETEVRQLKNVPEGSYIKVVSNTGKIQARVYIKGKYDYSLKRFECIAFDDISAYRNLKSTQNVLVGFIF